MKDIITSKTFDNGVICASEQSVIVLDKVYDAVKAEFAARGCYFLNPDETVTPKMAKSATAGTAK